MKKRPSLFQMFVHVAFMKVPFFQLRDCMHKVERYGLELPYDTLVSHHLCGGRMTSLVDGLIYAQQRGIVIAVMNAAARDVVSAHGARISLTEHIQAFERAGYRSLDGVPLDLSQLKHA